MKTRKRKKVLVLANPKGGNGKSQTAALIIEWCNYVGISIDMVDTDPGQTLSTWVQYCQQERRIVTQKDADLLVVDTAGTEGGCLPWIAKAQCILCPFRPNFADLDRLGSWFLQFPEQTQRKFIFFANAVGISLKHKRGMHALSTLVQQQGGGKVLSECFIKHREAIYPDVLEGLSHNFFTLGYRYKAAQHECAHMVQSVLHQLGIEANKKKEKKQ